MSDTNPWVHVSFRGNTYWVLRSTLDGKTDGPIAKEGHIDPNTQELLWEACMSDSYAHIYEDGIICRYGTIIGTLSEIEEIK